MREFISTLVVDVDFSLADRQTGLVAIAEHCLPASFVLHVGDRVCLRDTDGGSHPGVVVDAFLSATGYLYTVKL